MGICGVILYLIVLPVEVLVGGHVTQNPPRIHVDAKRYANAVRVVSARSEISSGESQTRECPKVADR